MRKSKHFFVFSRSRLSQSGGCICEAARMPRPFLGSLGRMVQTTPQVYFSLSKHFFDLFVTTALRLKLLLQARRVGFEKSVLPKKIIFISLFDIA